MSVPEPKQEDEKDILAVGPFLVFYTVLGLAVLHFFGWIGVAALFVLIVLVVVFKLRSM